MNIVFGLVGSTSPLVLTYHYPQVQGFKILSDSFLVAVRPEGFALQNVSKGLIERRLFFILKQNSMLIKNMKVGINMEPFGETLRDNFIALR